MEHQKMLHLLNEANDYKFVSRKWNSVNGNSKSNYGVGNEIIYNTEVLKSNLCDFNNTYIVLYRKSSSTSSILKFCTYS